MNQNDKEMNNGFLYVANKQKFVDEAMISAQSLRDYSKLPIAMVCTKELAVNEVLSFFDIVITNEEINKHIYLSKIIGIQQSPFNKTIFLDCDIFVCADITPLFELLDMADIATTQEKIYHTTNGIPNMRFKDIIPEFNSGFIVLKKNKVTDKILSDWLRICLQYKILNDMPGLREAILENFNKINYFILPEEFNSHGYSTMLILNGEVKIIHERLGTSWKTYTPHFLSYDDGKRFAEKINKRKVKRIYIPYLGVIPYNWSPANIIKRIKKKIGIKRTSKNL
jgi:lipopolysaccharide biosynthesis glycosyltransferase